jgi:DNA uptake protein ComE-like DNA-binding protein
MSMIRSVLSTAALTMLIVVCSVHTTAAQTPNHQTAAAPAKVSPAVVNINTATAAELDALPGIGAKTAARIVEYRQKNGAFKKVEEIL